MVTARNKASIAQPPRVQRGGAWDVRRPPSWRRAGVEMVHPPKPRPKTRYRAEVLGVAALTLGLAFGVMAARLAGLI